ncbi:hypothetical protein K432DRAFT_379363 [Lepidopterella palustris CBS 459.81]|uniref:Thioesterase domain-containing protein n=1 Tax=Lepidopterella palustris CBS 459.81 TaxID=1314670 RepID=A0A8E2EGN5_9PEZI|nr:hypothetical protein K432DRAFT_379363 [Lepidopterella palustris CBS 459.81]
MFHPRAVRAYKLLLRPETGSTSMETYLLVSVGDGLDGANERIHGGFTCALLDQVFGFLVVQRLESSAPATVELTIRFKKPVRTPCVMLARAQIQEEGEGRVKVKGTVEDGMGLVYAEGEGTFAKPWVKVAKL